MKCPATSPAARSSGLPLSGLDVIKGLVDTGMTSVIVTHEMRFAREVSDRVLFMAEGNILEQGAPEQIFNNPTHPRLQDFLKKVL